VPANYGACPLNDAMCLCSTTSVVEGVGSCVIDACKVQSERDATIRYMLGVCQSFVRPLAGPRTRLITCLYCAPTSRVSLFLYPPTS